MRLWGGLFVWGPRGGASRFFGHERRYGMLVLSRQRDEMIMIGDEVEITVVDIRGDKVRLGITAPRHIQVHRKEVYDAIKRENQAIEPDNHCDEPG